MQNTLSRTGVLAAVLACLAAIEPRVRADDTPAEMLTLKSGYSGKVLVAGARRIGLSVTLDEKGDGSGTLMFDPNIVDGLRSTTIAIKTIPVRIRLIRDEEHAARGRRLYELVMTGPEGKVVEGGERWLLVRPLKKDGPYSLIFEDKNGKVQDVLVLE